MSKKKIIYVDDEIINLKVFQMDFRDEFEVITCEYPEEASAVIEKEEVSVMITDYKMPNMTGSELIDQVKQLNRETRCMILSGYLENEVLMDQSKVFKFISKPYDKLEITNLINSAFEDMSLSNGG